MDALSNVLALYLLYMKSRKMSSAKIRQYEINNSAGSKSIIWHSQGFIS